MPHKRYGRENLVRKKLTSRHPTSTTSFQDLQLPFGLGRHVMTAEPTRANTAPGLRGSWVWPSTENCSLGYFVFSYHAWFNGTVQYPKKYFHRIHTDLYVDAMLMPIRLVCTKWNSTVELRYKWYWVAIRRSQLHSILHTRPEFKSSATLVKSR